MYYQARAWVAEASIPIWCFGGSVGRCPQVSPSRRYESRVLILTPIYYWLQASSGVLAAASALPAGPLESSKRKHWEGECQGCVEEGDRDSICCMYADSFEEHRPVL